MLRLNFVRASGTDNELEMGDKKRFLIYIYASMKRLMRWTDTWAINQTGETKKLNAENEQTLFPFGGELDTQVCLTFCSLCSNR